MTNIPQTILELVQRFDNQRVTYLSGKYNETQLRRDFLDPFFETLGWDVRNLNNASEKFRDVILEQSVEVNGQAKSADYLFKIGGTPVFFVEAKKPSVNIETDPAPAFQLKTYAWSKKLPFSILTDFEQLAFYECASKPYFDAPPSLGRIALYHYHDYLTHWEEISSRISRAAVTGGDFDTFVQGIKGKRGTTDVDDDFLAEMEHWREALARNIALRNPAISRRELNSAVQTTIDRIVFLRICEDRGIEPEDGLKNATDGIDVYGDLLELFRKADRKYNSGLFHFSEERGRPGYPDTLTPTLKIDDKVFKDILANLYLPKSPYRFNYFSADILGQVYERFLGKVISLTPAHRAQVDAKPEVRKAGGVYYTPTYIVDYIVKNTVGELLKDRTPDSFKTSPLRVLDPACGSGSFLIGAYQFLMDWYLEWYIQHDPASHTRGAVPAVIETLGGWQLTLEKKKQILLDHIYGVDIDSQAVEVTRLSLLLKVVENPGQLSFIEERILPDLGGNIKCGNSLIGPDFYEGRQGTLFDDEEQYRVNAFDWQSAFPHVFRDGGFDAVIGNPPYIRIQALKEWAPREVEFYKKRYESARKGNYDIYVIFVEKGLSLLNSKGLLGLILPSKFFTTDYGQDLRRIITKRKSLNKIIDFSHTQIFEQATTYTNLLFLSGYPSKFVKYLKVTNTKQLEIEQPHELVNNYGEDPWIFSDESSNVIVQKLVNNSIPLGQIPTRIGRGSSSGIDKVFLLKMFKNQLFTLDGEYVDVEQEILRIPVFATDFGRYRFSANKEFRIIFPYTVDSNGYQIISEFDFQKSYPKAYKYLLSKKKILLLRKQYKSWYGYSAPRNLDVHEKAQFLVPLLANQGLFCRLDNNSFRFCLMASGGFSLTIGQECDLSPNYMLGILNSRLLFWRLRMISNVFRGGWITCTKQYVQTLPVRTIDFTNPTDVALHDRMVTLVESMLSLHKQFAAARLPDEKERLQRQIDSTDRQIDQLVYQLYDLTPDEIKIVEDS